MALDGHFIVLGERLIQTSTTLEERSQALLNNLGTRKDYLLTFANFWSELQISWGHLARHMLRYLYLSSISGRFLLRF